MSLVHITSAVMINLKSKSTEEKINKQETPPDTGSFFSKLPKS